MSDIDPLAASMLMGLARSVDFAAACLSLAAELAELGCPSCVIGTVAGGCPHDRRHTRGIFAGHKKGEFSDAIKRRASWQMQCAAGTPTGNGAGSRNRRRVAVLVSGSVSPASFRGCSAVTRRRMPDPVARCRRCRLQAARSTGASWRRA